MGLTTERFREVMRIVDCIRKPEPETDLLTALLNGYEKNVQNVLKLRAFIIREISDIGTPSRSQFLTVCDAFLTENGVTPPVEGKPTGCVLDEFSDEVERLQRLRLEIWGARNNRTYEDCLHRYAHDPEFRKIVDAIDGGKS